MAVLEISDDTRRRLDELLAPGETHDQLMQSLVRLSYKYPRPATPALETPLDAFHK
jgi:hypothetical protein